MTRTARIRPETSARQARAAGAYRKTSPNGGKNSRGRVLVVDDEMLIRWSVGQILTHAGYDVAEAGDGKEALRCVNAEPHPDVILLDYRLPDSTDLRLLETIRGLAPESPVIMITASATSELISSAVGLGAQCVINKPVELHDLVPLVEQALASRLSGLEP
jgi:DNA-binding NtrC family response regulator